MKFNVVEHKVDNGTFWYFMGGYGGCFAQMSHSKRCQYVVLSNLFVEESLRNKGIALKLQEEREILARSLNKKWAYLWVKKDSWMMEWYKRRGYVFYRKKDETQIWMRKRL